jgi:replicative DNA helicase
MELGKIPPHDEEAEQAVLGSMLLDKNAVIKAVEVLNSKDFYRSDNETVYEACLNLYNKGESIDTITLSNELTTMGKLDAIGGLDYIAKLPEAVPTTANVERYIKIVEEKSLLRSLIKSANDMIALGYNQNEEVENIMDRAEQTIFELIQRKSQQGYSSIKDVLVESLNEIQELYSKKKRVTGVATGFADMDNMLSGLHNSDLILIAARPAMGKTAFAINIATNAAVNAGVGVALFSLEMSKQQCTNRILAVQSMVDSQKLSRGELEEDYWTKIGVAASELSDSAGIYIDDTPGITAAEIRAKCRKMKLEHENLGLIVIDYLQLISGSGRSEGRQQEVSEISRSLKILAKEINVPVIALSQLSRAPEQRDDHRPMLQDLRESGSIEQDADIVMFIYRDDYYKPEEPPTNIAEIIVAKNRSGPTGKVELLWMPQYTKFVNKYHE